MYNGFNLDRGRKCVDFALGCGEGFRRNHVVSCLLALYHASRLPHIYLVALHSMLQSSSRYIKLPRVLHSSMLFTMIQAPVQVVWNIARIYSLDDLDAASSESASLNQAFHCPFARFR